MAEFQLRVTFPTGSSTLDVMLRWRVIGYLPHLPLLLLPYLIWIHPGLAGLGLQGAAVYVRLLRHRHGRTAKRSSRGSHASKTALARARAAEPLPGWRAGSKAAASKPSLRRLLLRLAVKGSAPRLPSPETTNLRLLLLRSSSNTPWGCCGAPPNGEPARRAVAAAPSRRAVPSFPVVVPASRAAVPWAAGALRSAWSDR